MHSSKAAVQKMNKRFQILDCEVDFTEQTLVRAGEVFKQQHKVMQVLRCLLNKQGELVSIDELMNEVWPDTVVSPNTLQRCIAQLRKGLGDSSQTQIAIKTYPRRGYALIAEVLVIDNQVTTDQKLQNNTEQSIPSIPANTPVKPNRSKRKAWGIAASACTMMFVLVVAMIEQFHVRTENVAPKRAYITSVMTASDAHTGQPRFAPDGKHLVFQRYSDFCESTVWLQNVENKQEVPLTQLQKRINDVAWSNDGKQLLVAQSNPCIAPTHEQCWQLERIMLDNAMQFTSSEPVGTCEHQRISQVAWLNENIALFIERSENGHRQLTQIELTTGQKKMLFAWGDVLSFAFIEPKKLAVLSHQGNAQLTLYTINILGEVLQNQTLSFSDDLSVFSRSKLSYVPTDAQLLLENNGQLFEITTDGHMHKHINLPNSLSDFTVSNDAIAATRGLTKQDGALQSLTDNEHVPLFPSKGVETYFRFAPNSDAIAFVSNRTEALQVWVSSKRSVSPKQLSQFDSAKQIRGFEWLATGEGFVFIMNDQLAMLSLSGELKVISLPLKMKYLYQALPNNQALIEYQHNYQEVVAIINLDTLKITPLHAGLFNDVQLDAQNNLWFIDRNNRLNKLENGALSRPFSDLKVNGLRAYQQGVAISDKHMALFYLSGQQSELQKLQSLSSGAWLQDIKGTQFIWSHKHARNSDIVELAVTN